MNEINQETDLEELVADIVEDLQAALNQITEIVTDLNGRK